MRIVSIALVLTFFLTVNESIADWSFSQFQYYNWLSNVYNNIGYILSDGDYYMLSTGDYYSPSGS